MKDINKNYMSEDQADQAMVEENGLYRKWYQIEIPIRQDVADQLMDYEGSYKNGDKDVKLKGESLYYCLSRLCRLIDYKNIDNTDNKKSYKVYSGYNDESICEKLKISPTKWDAIKKVFYNAGIIEIIKRTYKWQENGIIRNGTRNIYVINRIPLYSTETEYCNINWAWRNYDNDKKNKALSAQFIKEKPKAFSVSEGENENTTMVETQDSENTTMVKTTVVNTTVVGQSSPYSLLSSYFVSSQSFSLGKERMTDSEKAACNKIIKNCELDNLEDINISNAIKISIQKLYFDSKFTQKYFKVPTEIIRENLLFLDFNIINYAIGKMQQQVMNGNQISSPGTYLTICIYNSISDYYTNLLADPVLLEAEQERRNRILEEWKNEINEKGNSKEEVQAEDDNEPGQLEPDLLCNSLKGTVLELFASEIKKELGENTYRSFISKLEYRSIVDNEAYFYTADEFCLDIIEKRYKDKLEEIMRRIGSSIRKIHILLK